LVLWYNVRFTMRAHRGYPTIDREHITVIATVAEAVYLRPRE